MNATTKRSRTNRLQVKTKRGGVAAVEAAIVLPLLIGLTFGMIDVAQYITTAQCVVNASREAARFASRGETKTVGEAEAVAREYLASIFPHQAQQMDSLVGVSIVDANGDSIGSGDFTTIPTGEAMTISVDFDFSAVRWLPGPKYSGGAGINSRTVCRRL